MSRTQLFATIGAAWFAFVFTGCGGPSGPPPPTAPSGPQATLADLTGDWAGTVNTGQITNLCFGITWRPALAGSGVAGMAAVAPINEADPARLSSGTMTGTIAGQSLTLEMSFPPGSFPTVRTCSMTGTGTARAGLTSMSGTVTLTWTEPCNGSYFVSGPTNIHTGTLNMTKAGSVPRACP